MLPALLSEDTTHDGSGPGPNLAWGPGGAIGENLQATSSLSHLGVLVFFTPAAFGGELAHTGGSYFPGGAPALS